MKILIVSPLLMPVNISVFFFKEPFHFVEFSSGDCVKRVSSMLQILNISLETVLFVLKKQHQQNRSDMHLMKYILVSVQFGN